MSSPDLKSHGFLLKTYNLLETQSYRDIIDWIPAGNGFIIHNVDRLEKEVLPFYFKHSNIQSFVRQLNMYGFHKIKTNKDTNFYTHPHFIKGDREQVKVINRKAQKKMLRRNQPEQKYEKLSSHNQTPKEGAYLLNYLPMILKINLRLMEEQNYLIQMLKKQWEDLKNRRMFFYNESEGAGTENNVGGGNDMTKVKIQQERTMRSMETYWNMQQQMYSKLYMESAIMLNREDGSPQTHTSISKEEF